MADYMTWVVMNGSAEPITLAGITLNSGDTLEADFDGNAVATVVNAGGADRHADPGF